jgi:hypothetical protein
MMATKYLTMETEEIIGMRNRIAALEAENAKLRAVAEAADRLYRQLTDLDHHNLGCALGHAGYGE